MSKTVLLIHGGAGNTIDSLSEAELQDRRQVLDESLRVGQTILQNGGTSQQAVVAAVMVMENSPLFNAGRGSVFTHEGTVEMDASIMCGRTGKVGGVGGVKTIKNPVLAAQAVMDHTHHALLVTEGAEAFARMHGLEEETPEYFYTDFRYQQLLQAREVDAVVLDHDHGVPPYTGTVGAVALDQSGNLAAATSTGGMTNKRFGRVGDSAIAGAGTYANNSSIAMSATGTGDVFVQATAGYQLAALYQHGKLSLDECCATVLQNVKDLGGNGGVIAIDHHGNYCFDMNTRGMYRGVAVDGSEPEIYLFSHEGMNV